MKAEDVTVLVCERLGVVFKNDTLPEKYRKFHHYQGCQLAFDHPDRFSCLKRAARIPCNAKKYKLVPVGE